MTTASPPISTTVRFSPKLALLRAGFRLGAWLQPGPTLERAGRLFSTPLPSTRERALRASTGDAMHRDIEIGGRRIRTYAWGDPQARPLVLFAHGWSSHGTRIANWLPGLFAAGYAVVAFDQPAHGKSEGRLATLPDFTRHLFAVGEHYGPAAVVIGHSLGGAAAMLALADGLRADRAILVAPAADPVDAARRFSRVVGLADFLGARLFDAYEARQPGVIASLHAHVAAPAIARPALVVHDFGDREVPWAEGERYARHWPAARLLTTTGLGHHRILDDERVIDAALRFLGGECVGERVVSTPNLPYGFA